MFSEEEAEGATSHNHSKPSSNNFDFCLLNLEVLKATPLKFEPAMKKSKNSYKSPQKLTPKVTPKSTLGRSGIRLLGFWDAKKQGRKKDGQKFIKIEARSDERPKGGGGR